MPSLTLAAPPLPDLVQETGERMVFAVGSSVNRRISYRVDLLFNGGKGKCQCTDDGVRRQPYRDAGGDAFTRAGACKHTIAARTFFLRRLLAAMSANETDPSAP